jgi:hypothetical protein
MRNVSFQKVYRLAALLVVSTLSISAVSADRLKTTIAWLADPAREGRHAGSKGAAASAEFIAGKMRELGYSVETQDFGGNRRNVVGRWGNAEKYIVIGAHYDGQGQGFPSASDNASGVAVMLELARDLKEAQVPVSIVGIAFDDEEQGLNGSRYYVDHSPYPLEKAEAAIIFDTLGRSFMDLSQTPLFILGSEYSKELAAVVEKRARPDMILAGTDLIGPRSDFAAFAVKHVPYLFFTDATHKDYHGQGDTPDRVDYKSLGDQAALIEQIVTDIARLPAQPKYLDEPIYPVSEGGNLEKEVALVEKERKDLPEAYRLMFDDLRERIKKDKSREVPEMAATAMLSLATPRLSYYPLAFYLGPFYEAQNQKKIAAAVYEEAIKYSDPGFGKRELERKVQSLRPRR